MYRDALLDPDDIESPQPKSYSEPQPHLANRPPKSASAIPPVHHAPRHREVHGARHKQRLRHLSGELVKRLIDVVGAIVLAVVLSPVLVVVGVVLVRQEGPILYRHVRTGRHGKSFDCFKFRTMVPNAEELLQELLARDAQLQIEWLRDQKLRHDPRVTAIGRFLRRTSLDELPQLWNVLKGEMSLVGPRPVVREEWARYGRRLDHYLTAKPGVTGLWQVMGRSDCGYRRRVALDCYYARKRNLFLDVLILLRTVKVVLLGRGAC